jgi:hypothetical protein
MRAEVGHDVEIVQRLSERICGSSEVASELLGSAEMRSLKAVRERPPEHRQG